MKYLRGNLHSESLSETLKSKKQKPERKNGSRFAGQLSYQCKNKSHAQCCKKSCPCPCGHGAIR